jgi:hypothetical protein
LQGSAATQADSMLPEFPVPPLPAPILVKTHHIGIYEMSPSIVKTHSSNICQSRVHYGADRYDSVLLNTYLAAADKSLLVFTSGESRRYQLFRR